MKINNYRLFIAGFAMVSWLLLTGFEKVDANTALTSQKQLVLDSSVKAKHKAIKNKASTARAKSSATKDAAMEKSLDLTLPFKDPENAWLKIGQDRIAQKREASIFAVDKKKFRSVDLDGEMLMSQEPEADKRKSVDGAGIVITLKR